MKKIDKIREARLNKKRSRKNNLRKVKVKIKKLEESGVYVADNLVSIGTKVAEVLG